MYVKEEKFTSEQILPILYIYIYMYVGGVDRGRLRHVLRDLAAVRPRGLPVHQIFAALRLPRRPGTSPADT